MKHPFDEIIDQKSGQSKDSKQSPKPKKRRAFLKRGAEVASFFAVAAIPRLSSAKPDPLDGIPSIPQDEEGWATTQAVGEEGGDYPTTLAIGEEGGDCNENSRFAAFLNNQRKLAQQQINVINKEIEKMYKQNTGLLDDALKQNWNQIRELKALILTKQSEIAQINTILSCKPWW